MSRTKKIINLANEGKPSKYNILTFPTHERYETQLCKTGHNFYSMTVDRGKKWNKEQVELPENYHVLPLNEIPAYIDFDFILVQSKFWQYQLMAQINQTMELPVVVLEHTTPTPQTIKPEQYMQMQNMIGNLNVFISKYSMDQWGITYNTKVINHGLDTEVFQNNQLEKKPHVLTVANDFINRDYCLNFSGWQRVTGNLNTRVVGDTKGLSEPASSTEDLVREYNECSVYFNSSTLSPIPMSLLEAMSCGCAVVSTATCMIPEVIEHGVNGFISNDEDDLRNYIDTLLNDEDLRKTVGENARKTIEEKFSIEKFVDSWNKVFDEIYEAQL